MSFPEIPDAYDDYRVYEGKKRAAKKTTKKKPVKKKVQTKPKKKPTRVNPKRGKKGKNERVYFCTWNEVNAFNEQNLR